MKDSPSFSWLRDLRVVALGIGCAIAGFLTATLIFSAPWHLPPAWGDIPTWLAFVAASVAGSAALIQLSQQQRQINAEAARNVERDKLVSAQLAEAAERINAIRRHQAGQIVLSGFPVRRGRDGRGHIGECQITNGSDRPIRNISCRMILSEDLIIPTEFRTRGVSFGPWNSRTGKRLELSARQ